MAKIKFGWGLIRRGGLIRGFTEKTFTEIFENFKTDNEQVSYSGNDDTRN